MSIAANHRRAKTIGAASLWLIIASFTAISSARAETRALLVGAWQFRSTQIKDLVGPRNDLVAMDALFRRQGANDVTTLENALVTRTNVERALHDLGERSRPGDWVILYYTGHGAQAEARVKGTRDGDRDQFLPLPGFDPVVQDPERFIVDKDFYSWLARYIPSNVQILMIADTCHSGTLNRAADPRSFHFTTRLAFDKAGGSFQLADRPLPQFPPIDLTLDVTASGGQASGERSPAIDRADLPNLIYIGASQDNQLALEANMPLDGSPTRGLLTYAFEHAFSDRAADGQALAADLDGNNRVSVSEMAIYLDSEVRALTAERQRPQTSYVGGMEAVDLLTALPSVARTPIPEQLPAIYASDPLARALLAGKNVSWRAASDGDHADFTWYFEEGALVRRSGDTVAEGVKSLVALRSVIDKWRAVEQLRPYMNEAAAQLAVGPRGGADLYRSGASVEVHLTNRAIADGRDAYATIFNLASDGTVQMLYPFVAEDGEGRLAGADLPLLQSRVVPPYGVDHVVAVITMNKPMRFRALLASAHNQRSAMQLVEPLKTLLAENTGKASLSIAQILTGH